MFRIASLLPLSFVLAAGCQSAMDDSSAPVQANDGSSEWMAGLDAPENTQAPPPGFDDSYGSTLCQPTRLMPGETVEFKVYPDDGPGTYTFFMGVGVQECSEDVLDGATEYVHASDCDAADAPRAAFRRLIEATQADCSRQC